MNGPVGTSGMTFSTALFFAALLGIALHILFIYLLRQRCPDEWIRLGSPHPLRPDTIESGWVITKYFLGGRFARVTDKYIVIVGRIIQLYTWLFLIGFALFTVLFFYAVLFDR